MTSIREARRSDLPALVRMLADDPLGAKREQLSEPLLPSYAAAFDEIDADPNQVLLVATDGAEVVGMLQLSFLRYLTYQGGLRAQLEGVRSRSDRRGEGIGALLIREALSRAQAAGAHVVQLTTDKKRPEARSFYERFGLRASHEGMKLHLEQS